MKATMKPSRADAMDARTRVICESVAFARTVSALATDSRAASAIMVAAGVEEGATEVDMVEWRSSRSLRLGLGTVGLGGRECL